MKRKLDIKYLLKTTVILVLITALTALLLAAVNALTAERIEQNELEATMNSLSSIFGEGLKIDDVTDKIPDMPADVKTVYLTGDGEYAVLVSPQGFKDAINLAVGIESDGKTVKGVSVISSSETSGIGSKAANDGYVSRFKGLNGEVKFGEGIDAISGATISSKAILKGINEALSVNFGALGGENR